MRLAGIALALIGCVLAAGASDQASQKLTVGAALDQYAAHPGADVPRRLAGQGIVDVLETYRDGANSWIVQGGGDGRLRRQHVAAAFAVELVALTLDGSNAEYRAGKPLVEWFCQLLKNQPPSEVERMAMLASLAAIQGAGDSLLLGIESGSYKRQGHIDHALARFPQDDRFKLIRIVDRYELRIISIVPLKGHEVLPEAAHRMPQEAAKRLNETLERLLALDGPLVRDEARLRRGVLQFVTGRVTLALQEFGAAAVTDAPFASYIANLMLGAIYYAGGDSAAAAARYSKAMHITPATSARLGLAASLMKMGNTQEAAAIAPPPPADKRIDDPWRLYGLGMFHELPGYLEAMRVALR